MPWNGATNIAVLDQGKSDADSTTYTTGSFALPLCPLGSPGPMVLFCTLIDGPGAATPVAPSWTRTTGGAAVPTTSIVTDSSAGQDYRLSIRRLNTGEGGFTDSLVGTSDATPDCIAWWIIVLYNVPNIAASVVQTNSVINGVAGTSNTLALGSAVAKTSNLVIGLSTHLNGNATTADQTRIGSEQTNAAPAFSSALEYRNDGTNSLSSSWTTAALNGLVMAELRTNDEQILVSNSIAT